MSFLKSIDKVLAGMGNMKAMQRTHVDTFTEDKMQTLEGEKIAESENGEIWIEYQELAGYMFMNVSILSRFNIKTKQRCKMIFLGNTNLDLVSDNDETDSDFSNVSNRWLTKMSFDISKEDIKYINNKSADQVRIEFKKKFILFNIIK